MAKLDRARSLTLQELELRAIRAKRRFKAAARLVIANRPWLEDVEDEQLSRNVKRNVQLLTRKKVKKGLLTLQQKSILCKPAEYRIEEEKILLNRIIGGLKCFRKYPDDVKMQLAGVTYFLYYGPNRTIVKQNHEAHALYFILSGEVIVSITTWDPIIKENVTINVGTMVAGSMFGEVSLLHDIPRTATITTATPCELLCLKKADFDIVLKASVKQQWDEIQKAMSRFEYFDGWNEVAVRECCIYSKIKPYVRDQTIVGDGQGVTSSAYFILKGQCRIIEHLLVSVSYNGTQKEHYKIYNPDTTEVNESEDSRPSLVILDERKSSCTSLGITEPRRSIFPTSSEILPRKSCRASFRRKTAFDIEQMASIKRKTGVEQDRISRRTISVSPDTSIHSNRCTTFSIRRPTTVDVEHSDIDYERKDTAKPILQFRKEELPPSVIDLPYNVETHFMQVCILSETGCFGLGENMKRSIIGETYGREYNNT
ncbi:hypothetical protein Trydic_g849 [Trypoxylus dichotomus]